MKSITLPVIENSDRPSLIRGIKEMCAVLAVTCKNQIAYILATAEHESANFRHLHEQYNDDAEAYFTDMYEGRLDLGNTEQGDGYQFYGRGLVHITGRRNYTIYEQILKEYGIDANLLDNPDEAARPDIACFTLVHGCMNGIFTGLSLSDFINDDRVDFVGARRVVNGMDKAELIADYAYEWLSELPSA
jgi:predicted chitinase